MAWTVVAAVAGMPLRPSTLAIGVAGGDLVVGAGERMGFLKLPARLL